MIFDVFVCNMFYDMFYILVYGYYNVFNLLVVIVFCYYEEIDVNMIKFGFELFGGVKCRFNEKVIGSQVLIDDYVYYLIEIKVMIEVVC